MAVIRHLRLPTCLQHLTKYELCLQGLMLFLGIPGFGTAIASIFVDRKLSIILSATAAVLLTSMLFFLFSSVLENYRQTRILKKQMSTLWEMLETDKEP